VAEICRTVRPPLEAARDGSLVACHRWREIPAIHHDGYRPANGVPTLPVAPQKL
jgi:hypothetical protein